LLLHLAIDNAEQLPHCHVIGKAKAAGNAIAHRNVASAKSQRHVKRWATFDESPLAVTTTKVKSRPIHLQRAIPQHHLIANHDLPECSDNALLFG